MFPRDAKVTECESPRWLLNVCLPVPNISKPAQKTQHVRLLWSCISRLYVEATVSPTSPSLRQANTNQTVLSTAHRPNWYQPSTKLLLRQQTSRPQNGQSNKAYPGFLTVISLLKKSFKTDQSTHIVPLTCQMMALPSLTSLFWK